MSDPHPPHTHSHAAPALPAPVQAGRVQVWAAHLPEIAGDASLRTALQSTLSPEEWTSAQRLRRPEDRDRAVLGRGMLRVILGRAVHEAPGRLRFASGPHGKPRLADLKDPAPSFNVTHSGAWWMLALGPPGMDLGIDVEAHHEIPEWQDIAARYFHPTECAALQQCPAPLQRTAFFDCWTRKEAVAKALGLGLSLDVATFVVPLQLGDRPVPVNLAASVTNGPCELWPGITTPAGYSAALCCAGGQSPEGVLQAQIRPEMLHGP